MDASLASEDQLRKTREWAKRNKVKLFQWKRCPAPEAVFDQATLQAFVEAIHSAWARGEDYYLWFEDGFTNRGDPDEKGHRLKFVCPAVRFPLIRT